MLKRYALFLSLPLLFSACLNQIEGNGQVRTETIAVDDFDEISVSNAFTLEINQGRAPAVEVTADDNLHRYLDIRVEGDELVVEADRNIGEHKALLVEVSAPRVTAIEASGAAEVICRGYLRGDELELNASGAASMELAVNRKRIEAELSGASEMNLHGKCNYLEAQLSGSSDLRSHKLECRRIEVTLGGASEAEVWAVDILEADLSGASELRYKGSPSIEKSVSTASEMRPL